MFEVCSPNLTRVIHVKRLTLTGLLRVCETSDMQIPCLSDEVRSRQWYQLMNSGLGEASLRGNATLSKELPIPTTVRIDDYRSKGLAQLDLVKIFSPPRARWRSSLAVIRGSSAKKVVRRQEDITLVASGSTPIQPVHRDRSSRRKALNERVVADRLQVVDLAGAEQAEFPEEKRVCNSRMLLIPIMTRRVKW